MQVLFGLEYAHALQDIIEASTLESSNLLGSNSSLELHFADVMPSVINPIKDRKTSNGHLGLVSNSTISEACGMAAATEYKIGGLKWSVKEGLCIDDYSLFWIGPDNSALANVVLTFNGCEIGAYFSSLVKCTYEATLYFFLKSSEEYFLENFEI